jgi:hypothetical protein
LMPASANSSCHNLLMKTRSLSLTMELGSPWRRTKSWSSSHATLLAAAPRSLPRPLPCASRATAHARKCASTHSSVGHLRIPSPMRHCILLLHTHVRDLAFLCRHCHQAHLIVAPPLRTTRAAAKGLNGSTLAPQCFPPNLITGVPPPPLCLIRRRPVSPLLPSSSKSYPRSWHTLLTSPSSFLMIGSPPSTIEDEPPWMGTSKLPPLPPPCPKASSSTHGAPRTPRANLATSTSVSTIGNRHAGENESSPVAASPWCVPACTTLSCRAIVPHRCCRRHSSYILSAGQP